MPKNKRYIAGTYRIVVLPLLSQFRVLLQELLSVDQILDFVHVAVIEIVSVAQPVNVRQTSHKHKKEHTKEGR